MKKESWFLYFMRLAVGLAFCGLMAMLYWSSLAIEERLRNVQTNLEDLQNQIEELKDRAPAQALVPTQVNGELPVADASEYPNLLEQDPFYKTTLPKILGPDFKPRGTFHISTVGRPDNLHPFSNWADVSSWVGMCNVSVGRLKFGFYETYVPDCALRVEQRTVPGTDIPEFWIFLRKNAFWQPLRKNMFSQDIALAPHFLKKHPVTAHDFKFFFDALLNPYNQELKAVSLRTYFSDLEEIKVIDDYTFTVRWKTQKVIEDGKEVDKIKYSARGLTMGLTPLASFVYKFFADGSKILEDDSDPNAYLKSSVWAQNFTRHWAKNIIPSCGGWTFRGMTDTQIAFERNKEFFLPLEVLALRSETQFRDTMDAIWQDFKSIKTEYYSLQPDKVFELEQFLKSPVYQQQVSEGNAIKRIDFLARSYSYIGWNQARPLFRSKRVRQALTMAIDRERIIREYMHGMAEEITGTFYKYSPSTDSSIKPFPFDPRQARKLLEEEGWFDKDGDGILDKEIDGKRVPFRFQLTYYVKNSISKSIGEYVSTALKEVGIDCELHGVDIADISATFDDKNFDALILGWALGTPPEDPRQLWYSTGAKEKGSSNAVGFANAEVDQIINALDYEYNIDKRNELYHRFDKILYDEQPYTFLYSPKTALLYREKVQNVFIPADRQDLVPGATVTVPDTSVFYLKKM